MCLECFENSKKPETIQYPYYAVKSSDALELLKKKQDDKPSPEMKIKGPDEVEVRCSPGEKV